MLMPPRVSFSPLRGVADCGWADRGIGPPPFRPEMRRGRRGGPKSAENQRIQRQKHSRICLKSKRVSCGRQTVRTPRSPDHAPTAPIKSSPHGSFLAGAATTRAAHSSPLICCHLRGRFDIALDRRGASCYLVLRSSFWWYRLVVLGGGQLYRGGVEF